MIEIMWEFQVRSERVREFETFYNSDGLWAELFREDRDYAGTVLLRDVEKPGRYVTVDRWRSLDSYHSFKARCAERYSEIDQKCEALTVSERLVGIFEQVR